MWRPNKDCVQPYNLQESTVHLLRTRNIHHQGQQREKTKGIAGASVSTKGLIFEAADKSTSRNAGTRDTLSLQTFHLFKLQSSLDFFLPSVKAEHNLQFVMRPPLTDSIKLNSWPQMKGTYKLSPPIKKEKVLKEMHYQHNLVITAEHYEILLLSLLLFSNVWISLNQPRLCLH